MIQCLIIHPTLLAFQMVIARELSLFPGPISRGRRLEALVHHSSTHKISSAKCSMHDQAQMHML